MAGLLIKYFLFKLYTVGWVCDHRMHDANRIVFSSCIFLSVVSGSTGCTGWQMSLHIWSTLSASKKSRLKQRSGEQSPILLFCFVACCRQWLFPPNGLTVCFCGLWGGRGRSRAFCSVSASLLNLTVIGTRRHEGPPAQRTFSSRKTWSTGMSGRLLSGSDLQTW